MQVEFGLARASGGSAKLVGRQALERSQLGLGGFQLGLGAIERSLGTRHLQGHGARVELRQRLAGRDTSAILD